MNEKYPDRFTRFLLAKNYKPTWTQNHPSAFGFVSCVGIIIIDEIQPQKDVGPIVTLERNRRKTAATFAIQFTTKLKSQDTDFCSE